MYDRLGEVKRQHKNKLKEDYLGVTLHPRDIDWLIEQAEKAKRLEIEIERVNKEIVDEMRLDLAYADSKIERYEKALIEIADTDKKNQKDWKETSHQLIERAKKEVKEKLANFN